MDDHVILEAMLGCRAWESIRIAEDRASRIHGARAVNRKRDTGEGRPEMKSLVWGLNYDTPAVAKGASLSILFYLVIFLRLAFLFFL